jgi:HopA1 effector protein family
MTHRLPTTLTEALDQVSVASDLCGAAVGDREVRAADRDQLQARLAGALYDLWHAGRDRPDAPGWRTLRDPAFEQRLRAAVPHESCVVPAQVSTARAGSVVMLNRVRVRVPAERLVALDGLAGGGSLTGVRMPAVLPALSPGFLVVNGSRGTCQAKAACLRVYVHLDAPEQAVGVWAAVVDRLECLGVPYRVKVTSAPRMFPRRDALVAYLGPESWKAVPDIHEAAVGAGVGGDVSTYVARLDAGVGLAWEPADPRPGMRGMSFGEHRSHAIAAGILAAAAPDAPGDRHAAVAAALRAARIDPQQPYRNIDSPDEYREEVKRDEHRRAVW